MTGSRGAPLDLARGLRGTASAALVGAVVPAVVAIGFAAWRWLASSGVTEFERWDDTRQIASHMACPIFGCMVVFACAGWANFAPRGSYRFAWSLTMILLISVLPWFVGAREFGPRGHKGRDNSTISWTIATVLFVPPVVAAAVLTGIRILAAAKPPPIPE